MSTASSPADIDAVRARLAEPAARRGSALALLGAGGFAAVSGLALAVAVFVSAGDLPSARTPPPPAGALFLGAR